MDDVRTQSEAARQDSASVRHWSFGPGRFGLSREKEAAGAARAQPPAMGFECGFYGNGRSKTESAEGKNTPAVLAAGKNHPSARSTKVGEEDDFGK